MAMAAVRVAAMASVVLFLVLSDFMLYWLHRMFHRGGFWKYHAIHHSSEDLTGFGGTLPPGEPVSGTILVDVTCCCGYFAERHALGRAVQHVSFGVRSRQSELDAGSV